ncbi:MAG TPA: 16S rRNA (adenine(1518)-N(6)/adenine(1519)-N(6))-dimethyltransferase, partial [Acidimicrobiia bacterium]
MSELLTPATVRALLDAHDLKPSRALGQNFLADPNTARRIVRLAGGGGSALGGRHVVEVGPGLGS